MIWSVAWRNVWRNKLRSLVVILATAIGLYGSLFMVALMNGMMKQKVDATIENEISDMQIHNPKFLENESISYAIPEPEKVEEILDSEEGIKAYCMRAKATGMASTARSGNGVMINGINPESEMKVTAIHSKLSDGKYFEKNSRIASIVISARLADQLKTGVGKKVVLTTAALNGETAQALFHVEGIYRTSNTVFDELNVFIRTEDLMKMVQPDTNIVSEIAIMYHDNVDIKQAKASLSEKLPALSVQTWKELAPTVLALLAMMDQFGFILIMIILLALTFGIINVMLMVIIERTRELGMLMAIGMNRFKVFRMIMLETIFMSVTGAVIGVVMTIITVNLTARNGINFASWSEGFEALGYSSHVFPVIATSFYVFLGFMVIIAAMLASVWPARKALKLQPADAVRDET
ncbi:MAG: FtsX-like permease family protein [Bacteroidales bacterium]|jgi:ABC-type lipoprotein release transport system permease subunit|nr:FtsX-like permease family protein [Bacteroidales bacterium]